MVLKELIVNSNKKPAREPPSVPFLWEEKPGLPKKDWKPGVSSVSSVPIPPVKLIASVPFEWEEKPGTPLPIFSQQPFISAPPPLPLPAPPMYYHSMNDNDTDEDDDGDDKEIFCNETDDSFRSAPSRLANRLVSSVAISTAVPVQKVSSAEDNSDPLETPSSPASETSSSTSSYATGVSSLAGTPFLECLFPLFPPHSGFLEKVGHPEGSLNSPEQKSRHFEHENNGITVRRPPTLGELIMMSRRRSYRRKAVQMRKHKLRMVNFHN